MMHFRIYCFDGANRIMRADWIDASNDAEAMQSAKRINDCVSIEVWQRDRLVGRHIRKDAIEGAFA